MSHYLKKFDTHAEYDDYINSSSFIMGDNPNVSLCVLQNDVHYHKYVRPSLYFKYVGIASESNADNPYRFGIYIKNVSGYFNYPLGFKIYMYDSSSGKVVSSGQASWTNSTVYKSWVRPAYASDNPFDIEFLRTDAGLSGSMAYISVNNSKQTINATYLQTKYTDQYPSGNTGHQLIYECSGSLQKFFGNHGWNNCAFLFAKTGVSNGEIQYTKLPSFDGVTFESWGAFMMCYGQSEWSGQAVELSQTQLYTGCFSQMFWGCSQLNDVTVHFTEWLTTPYPNVAYADATYAWLGNVSSTGIFRCPRALPIERGPSRIPEGWDIEYID